MAEVFLTYETSDSKRSYRKNRHDKRSHYLLIVRDVRV